MGSPSRSRASRRAGTTLMGVSVVDAEGSNIHKVVATDVPVTSAPTWGDERIYFVKESAGDSVDRVYSVRAEEGSDLRRATEGHGVEACPTGRGRAPLRPHRSGHGQPGHGHPQRRRHSEPRGLGRRAVSDLELSDGKSVAWLGRMEDRLTTSYS